MLQCHLDLGDDPWERLAAGPIAGWVRWDGAGPVPGVVRIRGAHSRRFPRKCLQLDFPKQRLIDAPPDGHAVRRVHLNADYIDPTMMRSALSYHLFDQMNVPSPTCRHVAVTINDEFAGVYLALESVDSDYCRRRGWEPGPIFYAINRNANFGLISPFSGELKHPLESGYRPVEKSDPAILRPMLTAINLAGRARFPVVAEKWFDIPGYLRWVMVAVFVGNRDGFVHNYALYRNPEDERFRIIPWDYDATWGIDIYGRPARLDRVPLIGWNKLTAKLIDQSRYRRWYREHFREALDGPLSRAEIGESIDKISQDVGPWVDKDRQKLSPNRSFWVEVDRLRTWAKERRALLLAQLEQL